GAFVKVAFIYALSLWKPQWFIYLHLPELIGMKIAGLQRGLSLLTSTVGVLALSCSVFIYVVTQRKWWSGTATGLKFFGTAAWLGTSTMLVTTSIVARLFPVAALDASFIQLSAWLLVFGLLKLAYEASMFHHLWDIQQGDLKRTA